jgi:hypothetical protein
MRSKNGTSVERIYFSETWVERSTDVDAGVSHADRMKHRALLINLRLQVAGYKQREAGPFERGSSLTCRSTHFEFSQFQRGVDKTIGMY